MKRITLSLILSCTFLTTAMGGEGKANLELKLTAFSLGKKNFYKLILVNTGDKDVTVITKGFDSDMNYSDGNQHKTFGYGNRTVTFKGIKLISSIHVFQPVTLKSQEGTILEIRSEAFPNPFDELDEAKTITISYEIGKEWAARHKLWSGKVSTQTFEVKDGKIIVPD